MSIVVPTPEAVASKWAARTSAASADYTAGVKAPKRDWQSNTEKAAANYQAAVQAGNIGAKFTYGVKRVGTAKWQQNAIALGSQRFASGVQNAAPSMSTGISPYLAVISSLTLPDRQPRGRGRHSRAQWSSPPWRL